MPALPGTVAHTKRTLGLDRLVLQIHDASFPADADEDLGRGSPYARAAGRFFQWAAELGFDAIQFGPRGMTSRGNPSPYDATIFSRNPLDLPLLQCVEQGRLSRAMWNAIRRDLPPPRQGVVPYPLVFDANRRALQEIVANASTADRSAARDFLAMHRDWLIPDALYKVLCREHSAATWREWGRTAQGDFDKRLFDPPEGKEKAADTRLASLEDQYAELIEDYALVQWLLAQEHRALRGRLSRLGLSLYGDLQVGLSQRDNWAWRKLFLHEYRLGAPPSRTTPSGQPWGYPVLNPKLFGTRQDPGPALAFVRARIARVIAECDGLRVDHPHGWVDPWVYRADIADPFEAVRAGARLFSSPNDPLHPRLADYAIARPEQIDPAQTLHADGHVCDLNDEQVAQYSLQMDEVVRQSTGSAAAGLVACEVLSTLPYPVRRVLQRHDLGRFRVVQKLSLSDPTDVYRIEQALPQDWIMLGTHDTPPIWQLAEKWAGGPEGAAWADYLGKLAGDSSVDEGQVGNVAHSAGGLVNACFTAMLGSQSRQVVVFFPDLFGMADRYNEPGLVSDANWSLRVPANFEEFHQQRIERDQALDLRRCLQVAAERAGR